VTLLSADGYGAAKPQPKEQVQKEAQSLWPQNRKKSHPAYGRRPGAYKRRECSFFKSKFSGKQIAAPMGALLRIESTQRSFGSQLICWFERVTS
jgi:hypothetical protein